MKALNVLINSSSHGSEKETANADRRNGNAETVSPPVMDNSAPAQRRTRSAKTGSAATAAMEPRMIPRIQLNARNRGAVFRHQIVTLETDAVAAIISLREQGV